MEVWWIPTALHQADWTEQAHMDRASTKADPAQVQVLLDSAQAWVKEIQALEDQETLLQLSPQETRFPNISSTQFLSK